MNDDEMWCFCAELLGRHKVQHQNVCYCRLWEVIHSVVTSEIPEAGLHVKQLNTTKTQKESCAASLTRQPALHTGESLVGTET